MADDPRAVRLARRRMLLTTSKPKEKLSLPIRGFERKKQGRIQKLGAKPMRLKVRK